MAAENLSLAEIIAEFRALRDLSRGGVVCTNQRQIGVIPRVSEKEYLARKNQGFRPNAC